MNEVKKKKLKTEVFTMRVTPKLLNTLKDLAESEEKTLTRIGEEALAAYVKEKEKEGVR